MIQSLTEKYSDDYSEDQRYRNMEYLEELMNPYIQESMEDDVWFLEMEPASWSVN